MERWRQELYYDEFYHSAKGTTWKNHKYIKKVGNKYYYKLKTKASNALNKLTGYRHLANAYKANKTFKELNSRNNYEYRQMKSFVQTHGGSMGVKLKSGDQYTPKTKEEYNEFSQLNQRLRISYQAKENAREIVNQTIKRFETESSLGRFIKAGKDTIRHYF